ncbi:translation initiation factor IF-2 associated domain-containing protein, partial [uncultured Sphingomonas sp.]|uniref:translation initiation factor IF-2 associated domain-containing protein n=1 Tax=uncultured Sphingomonas sp. TaxID=158754 RepID=UPI0035CBBCAB
MSDTDNDKPKLGMRAPLGLRRTVETGKVKQSFSHGRSNTVIVETKKRRFTRPGETAPDAGPEVEAASAALNSLVEAQAPQPVPTPARAAPSNETAQERQARMLREAAEGRSAILEESRRRQEVDRQRAADEERARSEERDRVEAEAQAAPPAPEPAPVIEPTPEPIVAEPAPVAEPVAVPRAEPEVARAAQ